MEFINEDLKLPILQQGYLAIIGVKGLQAQNFTAMSEKDQAKSSYVLPDQA